MDKCTRSRVPEAEATYLSGKAGKMGSSVSESHSRRGNGGLWGPSLRVCSAKQSVAPTVHPGS